MQDFWRIVQSMRAAADQAGVMLVTGDTKVVDRGKADKIFINTSGVGIIPDGVEIHPGRATPGDKIIVSGSIAVHGIAIMSVREGLEFETEIASDTAPLNGLVDVMLSPLARRYPRPTRPHARRASAAPSPKSPQTANVGMHLDESKIPVSEEVRGACEILGLDPLLCRQ